MYLKFDIYGNQKSNIYQNLGKSHINLWYIQLEEPAHRDNHLYMDIKGIPQNPYPEAFIEHIKNRVHHAGFHIISSILFLIILRKILLICIIEIISASIDPRIRISPDSENPMDIGHHIKEILENYPLSIEEYFCDLFYLMEKHIEIEEVTNFYQLQPSASCKAIWEWHREKNYRN